MPSDDLIINVRQINGYPFATQAGYGDAILLQQSNGGPYYSMSIQGAVASALAVDPNRGLGVGAPLPFGAAGNILAGSGFVSPADTGILFNCFNVTGFPTQPGPPLPEGLTYLATGVGGALVFQEAGFCFLGFPAGQSLTPVTRMSAAATLSLSGQLALAQQITVGRGPIGPNEAVTLEYFTLHAIVRNPGNGKLNLTTEDILNAGGAAAVNTALFGYPTAEHPVPEAHGHEIATAGWVHEFTKCERVATFNGRKGEVCLGVWDIVYAGGAPIWSPTFQGAPQSVTPEAGDDSTAIATTEFVHDAMETASIGAANVSTNADPPAAPVEGDLWYNPASGRLNVYTQGAWVVLQ